MSERSQLDASFNQELQRIQLAQEQAAKNIAWVIARYFGKGSEQYRHAREELITALEAFLRS